MSTAREREQILSEYGAWVEEKTLEGLDLSIEAYLGDLQAEENHKKVQALEVWAEHDAETFHRKGRRILGIKEEIDEQ